MAPFIVYYRHSAEIVRQSLLPRSHKAVCVQTSSKNETHERSLKAWYGNIHPAEGINQNGTFHCSTVFNAPTPPPPTHEGEI